MAQDTVGKELKQEQTSVPVEAKKKAKRSFWQSFGTFLIMGGWLLILVVILGIVIAISILTAAPKPG
ncbi:MAG: hypothetical protein Q8O16_07350 [Dehalococcoidia bacterium]|nr:hypothetical protein [Dehalococcoidia bacterium]